MTVQFPRRIVLVGLMGTGKTTVGRRLARRLDRRFVDLDAEIESDTGSTIPEIFATSGESAFRTAETEALTRVLADGDPVVVATGGGVVVTSANRELLRSASDVVVVWLDAPVDALVERVDAGASVRPLLAEDPAGVLTRLSAEREPLYSEVAHHRIGTHHRTVAEVAATVCRVVTRDRTEEDSSS
jgi:shikimate kinase